MDVRPMARRTPTTGQAERIHQLFDEAVAEHPGDEALLRGLELVIVQEPDDRGPGFPEPVEVVVQQIVGHVVTEGAAAKQRLLGALEGDEDG